MSLQSLRFMPVSLKLIVGMLSLGKYFKLEGAKVHVKRRHVSAFKGSSAHFIESFMYDYSFEALKNMASLLGSSSLLRIPRAPIKLVTGVGASATKVVGSLGHLAADLASDSQYRESQAKIRKSKKIKGFADGLVECATRLGEGAEGLFDILTAPVQGARSGGVSGFFKGIGKGLVGTIVKPITKVGEAVADVGTGIAKTFAAPSGECRDSFARKRIPRAFFGRETDTFLDYKELDAMLYSCLKKEVIGGMELVLPCCNQAAVVCFPEKLLIVEFFDNCDKIEIRREIFLAQIHAVTLHEGLGVSLVDIFGISLDLELDFPSCEEKSRFVKKIFNLLSQARADKKTALDWRETRQAFLDLSFATCPSNACESSSETTAQVQVWEVERFLVAYGWRSPFLILDSETRWRWVNERLKRHPRIDSSKTRSECAQSKSPPIRFGELWKPLDEWQIFTDPAFTDRDGWMYAISFNSSTWRAAPGISASVRKRKWIRNFG
jgi:vacuolar protein sorting-associated protein 13A/C